jgi:cysteine synthase A
MKRGFVMNVYESMEELVGNTPILHLNKIEKKYNLKAHIYAKIEKNNPAGSAKDRVALQMIKDFEDKGILKKGYTIIEPTSGNTGVGLSAIGVMKGYNVILVMPENMSVERVKLIKAYGAKVILTKKEFGMKGAIDKAQSLNKEIKNSIIAGQFSNPSNIKAHYNTTGREIYNQMDGKIDMLVAGIGTGGTISGSAKYLKEQNKNIKVIGVEPKSSPLITKGITGPHKIQGIGANFIPQNFKKEYIDEVITVSDMDAMNLFKELPQVEGLFVGISSAAALKGAISEALKEENIGKNIVCILPDTGERYLSLIESTI